MSFRASISSRVETIELYRELQFIGHSIFSCTKTCFSLLLMLLRASWVQYIVWDCVIIKVRLMDSESRYVHRFSTVYTTRSNLFRHNFNWNSQPWAMWYSPTPNKHNDPSSFFLFVKAIMLFDSTMNEQNRKKKWFHKIRFFFSFDV